MLKIAICSVAIAATGAAALFVPIDPIYLQAVGLQDASTPQADQPVLVSPSRQIKIVSSSRPGQKLEIRVIRAAKQADDESRLPNGVGKMMPISPAPVSRPISAPVPVAAIAPVATVSPRDAVSLVRNLQNELRRVGCYEGRVDGDWGPASRFAMASFVKSVNASLPTDRPDMILLSLVRRHSGRACGGIGATSPVVARVPATDIKTGAWKTRIAASTPRAQAPLPKASVVVPRLERAPRIVRDRTFPQAVAVAPVRVVPTSPASTDLINRGTALAPFTPPMALGAVSDDGVASSRRSITVEQQPSPNRARLRTLRRAERAYRPRRVERRTTPRRRYRRTRSRSWKRRVYSAVNPNGN